MKKSKVFAWFLALLMICSFIPVNVHAETSPIEEAQTGVLTLYRCVKKRGSKDTPQEIGVGSAFLIGSIETGQYIITNEHVLTDEESLDNYCKDNGISASERKNLENSYYVIVAASDVKVSVEVVKTSVQNDVAVLKLKENIYNSKSLVLSSRKNATLTQDVFALGYPYLITQFGEDFTKQKNENVNVEKGSISKFPTYRGAKSIMHSAKLSGGCSGGPLVDAEGNVLGVNRLSLDDGDAQYYYAVQIDVVREILDTLGIQYDSVDAPIGNDTTEASTEEAATEATTEAPAPVVDKTGLQSAISTALEKNESDYEADSWKLFTDKLDAANKVNDNAEAEQTEVDAAKAELEAAIGALEEKSGFPIIIVIAAVVVVLIIIVVVVLLSGKKKKGKANDSYQSRPQPSPAPQPAPAPQPMPSPAPVPPTPQSFYGEGAGETSVLNEGAGETTILSSQSSIQATLERKSNYENIRINKGIFSIGKERKKVDYCISDNNSISRNHAEIVVKNGTFYLIDQKSTNGTYLNDVKLNPLQEMELKNGDKIRLSDEEFVFKMN